MSLSEALSDLKAEVATGADFEAVLKSTAAVYEINPALLRRKFEESYGTVEKARAFATLTQEKADLDWAKRAGEIAAENDKVMAAFEEFFLANPHHLRTLKALAVADKARRK